MHTSVSAQKRGLWLPTPEKTAPMNGTAAVNANVNAMAAAAAAAGDWHGRGIAADEGLSKIDRTRMVAAATAVGLQKTAASTGVSAALDNDDECKHCECECSF
jgi:hypothetical protein